MPQDHVDFLQGCPWVHIEESPLLGRIIFVHAGLEADGSDDCEVQLERLEQRDARHPQPEALFGREGVLHTPPQLARRGVTVISGHHGRVLFRTNRVILDSCCGDERNPLAALVLPETFLVLHDGTLDPKDAGSVFIGRSRPPPPGCVHKSNVPWPLAEKWAEPGQNMPQGYSSPLE